MTPEAPESLHPRPDGFTRRDLLRQATFAGAGVAAFAAANGVAQETGAAPKPDERRASTGHFVDRASGMEPDAVAATWDIVLRT